MKELYNMAPCQSVRIVSVFLIEVEEELEDLTETDLPWSRPTPENSGHGNFATVCCLYVRSMLAVQVLLV